MDAHVLDQVEKPLKQIIVYNSIMYYPISQS